MAKDFEAFITQRCWDDPDFARAAEEGGAAALRSAGVDVPDGINVRVINQRPDTIYFAIPPRGEEGAPPPSERIEEMDIWSSAEMFIWLSPVAQKFSLFHIRNGVPDEDGE